MAATKAINVRGFTEDQLARLDELAAEQGLSRESYVRMMLIRIMIQADEERDRKAWALRERSNEK